MNEFRERLNQIDSEKLKGYLRSLESPCYESSMLKIIFPEFDLFKAGVLELYQNHFLLFHLLYKLQDEFQQEGQYLNVHFMRTFLTPYPEKEKCRYYEEDLNSFCRASCVENKAYCDFHFKKSETTALDMLSVKWFYFDTNNYDTLDEKSAEAFINGTWEIMEHYDAFKKSFDVLGMPETNDISLIKRKFRELAKQYHPDHGGKNHERFYEINNAYQLLKRLLAAFKQ